MGQPSFAQTVDEVTLVVSADGADKEEATKVALRSAIEQTYGTFVSANTTILNDELVKDEIVTIASGNITGYNEVNCEIMPGGKTFVTLQATVSIAKLVNYARNKGASTEFAGATLAANHKLRELNKLNEKKVMINLITQLASIRGLFDYKLELLEPKFKQNDNCYEIAGRVLYYENNNTKLFYDLLVSTVYSICLTENEYNQYRTSNIPYYNFDLGGEEFYLRCYLRNEYSKMFAKSLLILDALRFDIKCDNMSPNITIDYYSRCRHGTKSIFDVYYTSPTVTCRIAHSGYNAYSSSPSDDLEGAETYPEFKIGKHGTYYRGKEIYKENKDLILLNEPASKKRGKNVIPLVCGAEQIIITIPAEELSKISNFSIQPSEKRFL